MTCSVPTKPRLTAAELVHVYGRNIDLAMARKDMTPADVAAECGITSDALGRIRRNTRGRFIDPEILLRLTEIFECSIEELLLPAAGMHYAELRSEVAQFYHCS